MLELSAYLGHGQWSPSHVTKTLVGNSSTVKSSGPLYLFFCGATSCKLPLRF